MQNSVFIMYQNLDEVAFGEVAMAPPSLTARPRKVQVDSEKARVSEILLCEILLILYR